MRKLLNVLYVTTPEAYLTRDGENVLVKVEDEVRFRVPIHNLEGIITFGYTGASPSLMALCAEHNVSISFLTQHGKFLARVNGPVTGNVLLRRKQYRIADDESASAKIAAMFIAGKLANCRTVIQRALRDHEAVMDSDRAERAVEYMAMLLNHIGSCKNTDELRGIEGDAARNYFDVFDDLILCQKDDFFLKNRNKRPPLDNMNALLSFLYTMLAHDVQSALETVGLDPYVGFLHKDRPGRASLALDIMEELRPYLSDRLALSLVNRRQIDSKGFNEKESGGIIMDDDTRKIVLTAWQKRKQEEIIHPYLEEKIPIGLLPYVQAMLLARHLRGDIEAYPPFLYR